MDMFHYSFTTNPTISNGWSSYPAPKMVHPMLQPYPIIVGICWLYYLYHIPNYIRCINTYITQYIPMTQWLSYPFISPISLQHDIPTLIFYSHVIIHIIFPDTLYIYIISPWHSQKHRLVSPGFRDILQLLRMQKLLRHLKHLRHCTA